jgi:hypothetical protein
MVEQTGVACHTGRHNCFFRAIRDGELETIAPVESTWTRSEGLSLPSVVSRRALLAAALVPAARRLRVPDHVGAAAAETPVARGDRMVRWLYKTGQDA